MYVPQFTLKEFLASEVKPALGCTEPGAVALAVARARECLDAPVTAVEVVVSDGIFKNGASVGIPGTEGMKGNNVAAALAVLRGNSHYGLEVLKDCGPDLVPEATALLPRIRIHADAGRPGVYVYALVHDAEGHSASCTIESRHDNIVQVVHDGREVFSTKSSVDGAVPPAVSEAVRAMTYSQVLAAMYSMTEEDVLYLLQGARMNMDMARKGLNAPLGLQTGRTLMHNVDCHGKGHDLASLSLRIKAFTAAAADARMGGLKEPVMSSAGSGNHGLTAIIPVAMAGEAAGKSSRQVAEALAFSHLSTSYVKSRLGRLSPVCGCTACAGAGAAAGLVYLLSEQESETTRVTKAANAMAIILGNLAGMICDGAKDTCALKVGTAAMEACHAALLALEGHYPALQGIVDESIENTVHNLESISSEGMKHMDRTIIGIVEARMNQPG